MYKRQSITINYEIAEDHPLTIILRNAVGQVQLIKERNGDGVVTISTDDIPVGIYFLQLLKGNEVVGTEKIVKVF